MRTLIIIPAYNEQDTILEVVQSISNLQDVDYLVINDCSSDNTKQLLEQHKIPYLDLIVNLGIGGAVHTGYQYAYRNDYDYVVQIDGDGQHDVSYIPMMLDAIQEQNADMVIGSRFVKNEGFQSTWMRRVGIHYLTWLIRQTTGHTILDPTSGYRLVGKDVIALFAMDYPRDYPEPESTVQLLKNGMKVIEVPVKMKERIAGTSSIGPIRAVYYMVKVTFAILLECMRTHERKQV